MKKLLYIIMLFFAIASCSPQIEQVGTPFVAGQEVILSASMPNSQTANYLPEQQRISGKDKGDRVELSWDEDDQILVSVDDKSAVFTLESGEGATTATFKGQMPADGTSYSVSYPIGYNDDLLKVQPYVENGFGKGLMKMSTKTNGTEEVRTNSDNFGGLMVDFY